MGEVLRTRPSLMTVFAVLAISAGLTLGLAREALADYSFFRTINCCGTEQAIDSDGFVPEYGGTPIDGSRDGIIGYAYTYIDGGGQRYIRYDGNEMTYRCATSSTWDALRAHERAHTRGWGHGEIPSKYNAAYNRTVTTPC